MIKCMCFVHKKKKKNNNNEDFLIKNLRSRERITGSDVEFRRTSHGNFEFESLNMLMFLSNSHDIIHHCIKTWWGSSRSLEWLRLLGDMKSFIFI